MDLEKTLDRKFRLQNRMNAYPRAPYLLGGAIALLMYLGIAWFFFPPEAVWSPDTGAKFLQLRSLRWEDGRLAYDIRYPGRSIDPDLRFATNNPQNGLLAIRGNKLHLQRLPIFPLLTWPWFHWLGFRGLYVLPAIGGAASSVLALHLLEKRDRRFAMWVLIAFGSPLYIYSTLFWEHTVATGLVFLGAWLALRAYSAPTFFRKVLNWAIIGSILGISAYIRLETLIFAAALLLALWIVSHEDRWGIICAGAVLGLVMLPYRSLHRIAFAGQEIPGHAEYLFYPFSYLTRAKWGAVPDLLIGPFTGISLNTDWLGILWAIATVIVIAHSFGADTSTKRIVRLVGLTISAIVGAIFLFTPVTYRAAHGLLFTTPWAILGLSRAYEVWQCGARRARIVVLTGIIGLVGYSIGIVIFRGSSPHGGLEWGARFAMSFYPLWALTAVWDLGIKRKDIATYALMGALIFLGLGFQIRGLRTIHYDRQTNAALNQLLLELPEQHLVSNLDWFHLNAAPIYDQKQVFITNRPEDLKEWVERAAAQHVDCFLFVTLNNATLHEAAQIMETYRLEIAGQYKLENLYVFQTHIHTK